ncbi:alpha/beta fold hydrolase [Methylovulum miyakonense]|uniref:alpha/beta fold hydrolase n=1 Tax=Methylovulum miyakonense TaxID=645578 RepID=UPI000374658B|nr:alpha/beta hydrolase [Methylovulum miyakonense]
MDNFHKTLKQISARCVSLNRAAALALLLLATGCGIHTAPFTDAEGRMIPGSIATMETLAIGGVPQSVWFRGVSQANPILILLHGGPGISESALFRHFNPALEQHFLVVYWEQRGAGRSYHADIPPESMTISRFVSDLDELVAQVTHRFGQDKVVLLGHSWGSALGVIYTARHPQKVAAYVGVAQIADMPHGDQLSYGFALAEAKRRGNTKAVSELEEIGPPPYSPIDERLAVGNWVERFGGVFHASLSTGKLIWAALGTDEANLIDLVKFGQGNRFSLELLDPEISRLDLTQQYRSFDVPIFFLLGRYDRHIPAELAAHYFDTLTAPCKQLVWFEQSAHNPPFEEPDKFNHVLTGQVLPLVQGRASCPKPMLKGP